MPDIEARHHDHKRADQGFDVKRIEGACWFALLRIAEGGEGRRAI